MTRAHLTSLCGDGRTTEHREWSRWLKAAAALVARFDDELEDDPFAYNETASVSLLAAAAAKAGYLGLAEFSVIKGHKEDRRRAADGRCDFWMAGETKTWAFEFKQTAPELINESIWRRTMESASHCARCLRASEADERVAGLIVSLYWHEEEDLPQARSMLQEIAAQCDFAWLIKGRDGEASDTFFYFDLV
jgi:hypothetical protein